MPNDFPLEDLFRDRRPKTHVQTGPKTPEGKAKSSLNGLTHGLRSKALVLPDETEEEFDAVRAQWMQEFQPDTEASKNLLQKLIVSDWMYQRNERRLMEAEMKFALAAGTDLTEWPAELHHQMQLLLRYKTTAERTFQRFWNAVSQLRKDAVRESMAYERMRLQVEARAERRLERERKEAERAETAAAKPVKQENPTAEKKPAAEAEPKTRAEELFQGQDHPKKLGKVQILDQWVEIRVENGKTTTTLYPPNEELIKEGKKMLPPPTLVYRRMNFVDGVPPEYRWAATEDKWELGGCGIQRMTVDTWLEVIEKEKQSGTDLLMPVPNLPRPKERGGCDCESCRFNEERLEREKK